MRTGELAGRAGVNTETLRYYERRGLLDVPPRTPGGYRDYPVSALRLLRFVRRAQELGFTLDEVEELLQLDAGGPESCCCDYLNFFTDRQAAETWVQDHPHAPAQILDQPEAEVLAARLFVHLLEGANAQVGEEA